MIKSSLCDYSDPYMLVCGTLTVEKPGTAAARKNRKKCNN